MKYSKQMLILLVVACMLAGCTSSSQIDQEDFDNDGILNGVDNCQTIPNPLQEDTDNNGVGDACEDDDGDGVVNYNDNCPADSNPNQEDLDGDGVGDACDPDDDNDGVSDFVDNCPTIVNPGQEDNDSDGVGDACQDSDNDSTPDISDNCPNDANTDQLDFDGDGLGDVCDDDIDGDGVWNVNDLCPYTPTWVQWFMIGYDGCIPGDGDGDGVADDNPTLSSNCTNDSDCEIYIDNPCACCLCFNPNSGNSHCRFGNCAQPHDPNCRENWNATVNCVDGATPNMTSVTDAATYTLGSNVEANFIATCTHNTTTYHLSYELHDQDGYVMDGGWNWTEDDRIERLNVTFTNLPSGNYFYRTGLFNTSTGSMVVEDQIYVYFDIVDSNTTETESNEENETNNDSHLIEINGMTFDSNNLTINIGDSVTWTNLDSADHTATADGTEFDSGTLTNSESFTFTFTTAGTYTYHCGIHSSMTGTITVQ